MARTYWVRHGVAAADGCTLDAAACLDGVVRNAESVYETGGWEQCIVLPKFQTAAAGWYFGPLYVPIRVDRDGLWRGIGVTALAAGGTGQATLYAYVLPDWRAGDASDDNRGSIGVATGTTLAWRSEVIVYPRRWDVMPCYPHRDAPAGDATEDESTVARYCLVHLAWASVATSPRFGGVRLREVVAA